MTGSVPRGEEGFRLKVEALGSAITVAVDRLADLDAEDDPVMLARMLDDLISDVAALSTAAPPIDGTWRQTLEAARDHLLEAHDLLDDGEPSDAVAVEVIAAGDRLRRRLEA